MPPPISWPLSKLQARVYKGVLRDDLAASSNNYADYINEALVEFQDKHSWTFMRKDADVTILDTQFNAPFPADFKELQFKADGSPVNFRLQDPNNPGALFAVDVYFESQEIKRLNVFSGQVAVWFGSLRLWMKTDSTGTKIGMEVPAQGDLTFRVSYNAWLPVLVNPDDTNPISDHWPTMVIAKAKALALADVNDPIVAQLETYTEAKFNQAILEDTRADLVGRDLHM